MQMKILDKISAPILATFRQIIVALPALTQRTLILLVALCSATLAHAEKSSLRPVASAQIKYDDNVFLVSREESPIEVIGDTEQDDVIIEVGGGLRGEIIGRENREFTLEAIAFRREYDRFERLDFTGGSIDADLDFEIARRWMASLDYDFIKDQSSLNDQRLPFADSFNNHRARMKVKRLIGNSSNVYVAAGFNDKQYEERTILDNQRAQVVAGYEYVSAKKSVIGFELSTAQGEYTSLDETDLFDGILNDFDEDLATAIFRLFPSPKTKLNVDIGYVNRTYEDSLSAFDYDGVIFDVSFVWELGARTEFTSQYKRELNDTENTNALFTMEDQAIAQLEWLATENLSLSANVKYRDIEFTQIAGDRIDDVTIFELKSSYKLSAMFDLEIAFRDLSRDSTNLNNQFDKAIGLITIAYNRKK